MGVFSAPGGGTEESMPRKPNYRFERQERDRRKAAKQDEKRKAKEARRAENSGTSEPATDAPAPVEPGKDPA